MELIKIIYIIFIALSLVGIAARKAHDDEGYGWLQSIGIGIVIVGGGGALLISVIYIAANIFNMFF